MRELDHVDSFLLQVDTRGTFLKLAELLSDAAAQDTEAREKLSAIRVWTQKQIDILAQQVPSTGIPGNILGTPAEESVLAVTYLRAQAALHANVPAQLPELKKVLADTTKVLDSLEPDFITGLLMETEKRASRDPLFANNLNQAKEDLRWLGGQLIYLPILDLTQTPQTRTYQQGVAFRELSAAQQKNTPPIVIAVALTVACFFLGVITGAAVKAPN